MRVKVNHPVGRELYGLPRLGFLEPLDVRLEELLDELGLGVHVVDKAETLCHLAIALARDGQFTAASSVSERARSVHCGFGSPSLQRPSLHC